MEKTEGGKDQESGISEAAGSPPRGGDISSPSRSSLDPSGKQQNFGAIAGHHHHHHGGLNLAENKAPPSPPHSATTATLTTTGSSSGAPSVVGTSNPGTSSGSGELLQGRSSSFGSQQQHPHHVDEGADQHLIRLPASVDDVTGEHGEPYHRHHSVSSPGGTRYSQQVRPMPQPQMYEGRYNPSRFPVAIKMLVSNNVAGSIIGRQGQTISELQSRSMTRIKLSQSGDYFPGTHDRVCLIQGEPVNIKTALRLLLERMHLLHEQECAQHATWQMHKQQQQQAGGGSGGDDGTGGYIGGMPAAAPLPAAFNFVVRLLVPSSSCGMIIGKAGSNIKFLEESTGVVSVRLSPKDSLEQMSSPGQQQPPLPMLQSAAAAATSERAVTITGSTLESCLQCTYMVFEGMISHPDVSRYSNMTTSYARKSTGGAGSADVMASAVAAVGLMDSSSLHSAVPPHQQQHLHHAQHHMMQSPFVPPTSVIPSAYDPLGIPTTHPGLLNTKMAPPRRVLSSPDIGGGDIQDESTSSNIGFSAEMPTQATDPSSSTTTPHQAFASSAPTPSERSPYHFDMEPHGAPHLEGLEAAVGPRTMHHSVSAPDLLAFQLDQSLQFTSHHQPSLAPSAQAHQPLQAHHPHHPQQQQPQHLEASPKQPRSSSVTTTTPSGGSSSSSFIIPATPTCLGPNAYQAQIAVPDSMIGSILGRAGRTLNELQVMSGTRIWISQRGEYVPGTRNRVVTVRGPTGQSVWQAQMLISQRIVLPPTASAPGISSTTSASSSPNSNNNNPTNSTSTANNNNNNNNTNNTGGDQP